MKRVALQAFILAVVALLTIPIAALAVTNGGANPTNKLTFPPAMVWVVVVAIFTPLAAYLINSKLWRNASEPVKALVQVAVSAVAAGVTTAITTNVFGLNNATLELILVSVVTSLKVGHPLWVKAQVQQRLVLPRTAPAQVRSGLPQ